MALVNIVAIDLRTVLNEKKDDRFFPNARIRNVWIPKQYLVHKDKLVVKGKVSTVREKGKNGRYPYHSKQEIKKEKPFKEKNGPPKKRHNFPKEKGRNTSRRKIPPRFVVSPPVPPEQKCQVVQHKKFLENIARTQKRRMKRLGVMEKRELPEEMS